MWKKENLEMVCSLDINHPLPVLWDYKIDEVVKSSKKIMFAVRILDIINKYAHYYYSFSLLIYYQKQEIKIRDEHQLS